MKKSLVEQMISQGIYGQVEDQPSKKQQEDELEVTLGQDVPIDPGPQMATQLSVQRPPVEDPDFKPGSAEELARSAYALSEEVPSSQIEWLYGQLKDLIAEAEKRHADPQESVDKEVIDDKEEIKSESVRRFVQNALNNLLKEQTQPYQGSAEDEKDLDQFRGIDYFGDAEPVTQQATDSVSLEDLAAEFGYSGAPGIRQEINRLTDRMNYFATKIKDEDLQALQDYAAVEYIDTLEALDVLDPEDIKDLQSAPASVKEMDSFRFFFVSGFVLPAFKEVNREASKRVKAEIEDMGLPKELHQTIFNQVTGATKSDPALITKKLQGLVAKEKIKADEVQEIANKIRSAFSVLKAASETSDDLVQKSLDRWQSMSKSKKKTLLNQAFDQTTQHSGA